MFYKKPGFPEENEILICTIKKILPNCVFVDLDEYKDKEGVVQISEVSPGRIRNIRDFVKEGKKIICKVLKINEERNHIDLSLRRVNQAQRINKNKEYKQEQRSEKILESLAKQKNLTIKDAYEQIGYKLVDEFGTLNDAFQEIVKDENVLKFLSLDPVLQGSLINLIKSKIKPKEVKISATLKLISSLPNGIEEIKKMLKKVNELITKDNLKCDILYAGAPNYRLTITSTNYKEAEKEIEKIEKLVVLDFKSKGKAELIKK